jgi:Fur family ferric uptake transcriptional regulator
MHQIHKQEKEQFRKLFEQEQVDRIDDRFRILEAFLQTEQHVTETELIRLMKAAGREYPPEFVRETLQLMCRYGFASKNRFDNGQIRYEHLHLGQHHDHLICTRCKRIFEFTDKTLESLQQEIASNHGFHMLQHRMEIYGICSDCLQQRTQLIALHHAKPGERLVIRQIRGGPGARMRLLTMGLRVGDRIEVITNQNKGQVVVAADFKRYALGRGLAEKILVDAEPD